MPPVFAAIGAFVTFGAFSVGTSIAIGEAIVGLGASLVLGGVSKLLAPKTKSSISNNQNMVNVRQPISSWRIIYGSIRAGGVFTFIESDIDNQFLNVLLTIAGHKIHDLGEMYFDNELVPRGSGGFNGHSGFHSVLGRYAGVAAYEWNLGTDTQTALPGLTDLPSGLWTANHRQRGRAGVHVSLFYVPSVVSNGVPAITWDIQGKEVLDTRLSPPTEVFSDNPALCIRDYLTNADYGMAAKDSEIDEDSFIAAANICDELVPLRAIGSPPTSPGSIKRYTCNGDFETSELPKDVLGALLSSCAGRLIYSNGKYKLFAGAWRTPNPDVITEDDLRAPITVQTRVSKRDLCNGAKGIFISPDNQWQPSDFPPYQNAAYVAEDDGEVLWKELEYPFTTLPQIAQRLAKIEVEKTRRQISISLRCKLSQYPVAPLDIIKVTNTRFGWTEKTFEVQNVQLVFEDDENGVYVAGVDIQAQEADSAIYDWDADTDETITDAAGDIIMPVPFPVVNGAANRSYRPLSNPITATDAGGSPGDCTINIDDFTMRIQGLLDTPYDSGSITGLDYNTLYYVYFDDPNVEGGTVTYHASTVKEDALTGISRFFLGSCTTPRSGAIDTVGNNDGGTGAQIGGLGQYAFTISEITSTAGNGAITDKVFAIDGMRQDPVGPHPFSAIVAAESDGNDNSAVLEIYGAPGLIITDGTIQIKILRAVGLFGVSPLWSGGPVDKNVVIEYSIDDGGSYTEIESYTQPTGVISDTIAVNISPSDVGPVNLARIRLRLTSRTFAAEVGVFGGGHTSAVPTIKIGEAWLEVTS